MKLLKGVYSAIFSVYDENLKVKKDTVRKLVDYQLQNGLKVFYVCGNTGECTVLPVSTRKEMLETVVEANGGRGQIVAHIGAGVFADSVELAEHANSLKIDAIASLPPSLTSYYKADEVVEYYKFLAKKSRYPVYAYVTPVLNCPLVEFADKISRIENIAGLKLSVNDYYTFGRITARYGDRLNMLNGPDQTFVCGLIEGADGAIGTTYNICPKTAVKIYESFLNKDLEAAKKLQDRMNAVIIDDAVVSPYGIAYWKAIMSIMGYDMGYTVFPARMPDAEYMKNMERKLYAAGLADLI